MSLRKINLVSNEYYHIYNRGNGKNRIFLDEEDYNRFIKLLYISNSKNSFNFRNSIVRNKINAFDFERGDTLVDILSWVLMPNHFHIILISFQKDLSGINIPNKNNITEFMRKVCTSYSMYFNKKYKRSGVLFEGKFKANYINKENYFNYLFSYVHLNPIKLIQKNWKEDGILNKKEALQFLNNYKYSSFIDFFNKLYNRREGKIISRKLLPEYISKIHINELFEWLKIGDEY